MNTAITTNFRGETFAEARQQLVNVLKAQKSWVTGYAESYVDEFADMATTRPTPEAQEAARYRWLRQFDIGIDHQGYDDYRWYAYAKPEPRNGRLGLDAVIDAALALSAQGEGKNG